MRIRHLGQLTVVLAASLVALALSGGRCAASAAARGPDTPYSPPPFRGSPSPPGVLRIWGPKAMRGVVGLWARGFARQHPGIRVQMRLMGSDTAIPGLYSGSADVALMGRRDNSTDDNGFSRPKGYRFRRLKVMQGSLDTPGASPALAVLVSNRNPIGRLTLAQLAGVARCGCEQSKPSAISNWGALGAKGAWAERPVHLYLIDVSSGTGLYFLRTILGGERALGWERVRDFHDRWQTDGRVRSAAARTAAAVRRDPYGIAISTVRQSGHGLRAVAIAARAGGPFVAPQRATIVNGSYPLARSAYAFVDQPPGRRLSRKVWEFLRYVLSPEGQADVARSGGYLPLGPSAAAEARARLRGWSARRVRAPRPVDSLRRRSQAAATGDPESRS